MKKVVFYLFLIFPIFAEDGVKPNEILIGQSCVISGHAKALGIELKNGADAYIQKINEEGVFGRKIKIVTYDDGYEPEKCLDNTNKLINNDKVFVLFGYVGTPTVKAAIPLLDYSTIPLIGAFTGASFLRETKNGSRNILNIRASYEEETMALVKKMKQELGVQKFAVFYQNDSYGRIGLEGVLKGIKKHKASLVASGTYVRNSLDIIPAFKSIFNEAPQAIILIGAYKPCAKFIALSKKEHKNVYYANISFVGTKALIDEMGQAGEGVIISQVMPSPEDETIPLIQECKNLLGKTPTYGELEGFLYAKVLVAGLKECGKDLRRSSFMKAIYKLSPFDVGGFILNFEKNQHQGSNQVYFTVVKNGKALPVQNLKNG